MGKCDDCMHGRTCGFRDDWVPECYNYGKEEEKGMDAVKIGRRLRELRGFDRTQEEVANSINIDRSMISLYESGKAIPTDEIKIALADYYGVSVGSLFYAEE